MHNLLFDLRREVLHSKQTDTGHASCLTFIRHMETTVLQNTVSNVPEPALDETNVAPPAKETRGQASERLFKEALLVIMRQQATAIERGRQPECPVVASFIHAEPNSPLDRQKIDFLIKYKDGREAPIQVKSSARRLKRFVRECRRLRLYIHPIVINPLDEMSIVINKVKKCLMQVFNTARRLVERHVHIERTKKTRRHSHKEWCYRIHAPMMCQH